MKATWLHLPQIPTQELLYTFLFLGIPVICFLTYQFLRRKECHIQLDKESPEHQKILQASGTQLAQSIRYGSLSSENCVHVFIQRQKTVHPYLNAVVVDRYEDAIQEARAIDNFLEQYRQQYQLNEKELQEQLDKDVENGKLPPFIGVPCSIKESFQVKGMPNTSGLVKRIGLQAAHDAITVRRLRKAGFIPLGLTNVSELCMWMESNNRVYNQTKNPYDHTRIVGGSSGGEACIVSACGAPVGLGADVGGSIRLPAFFNGIFGHKPSAGLVPNAGQHPNTNGEANLCLATGPFSKHAEDLWPILQILLGPDDADTYCRDLDDILTNPENSEKLKEVKQRQHHRLKPYFERSLGHPSNVDLTTLRVLNSQTIQHVLVPKVNKSMQKCQEDVVTHLSQLIHSKVVNVEFHRMKHAIEIWSCTLSSKNGITFRKQLEHGGSINLLQEYAKWFIGTSNHTLPALGLCSIEGVTTLSDELTQYYVNEGEKLVQEIESALGDHGVLLFPSQPTTALKHHFPLLPTNYSHLLILVYSMPLVYQ